MSINSSFVKNYLKTKTKLFRPKEVLYDVQRTYQEENSNSSSIIKPNQQCDRKCDNTKVR